MTFTEAQARAIYAILMKECGARGGGEPSFIHHMVDETRYKEFRLFGSELGEDGYLHVDRVGEMPFLSCGPRDRTPEVLSKIERANARIKAIFEPAIAAE